MANSDVLFTVNDLSGFAGNDMRNITEICVSKIREQNYKHDILRFLQNPDNSIFDKVELLKDDTRVKPFSVREGGLYKFWDEN